MHGNKKYQLRHRQGNVSRRITDSNRRQKTTGRRCGDVFKVLLLKEGESKGKLESVPDYFSGLMSE